jgi:Glycosyltransferase family 87
VYSDAVARLANTGPSRKDGQESRIAGLLCVILGSAIFLWTGIVLERSGPNRMVDFRSIYYNVRVLLNHEDPYNTISGERFAMDDGEMSRVLPIPALSEITCVYPPGALLVNAPMGFLRWGPAHVVWMALNGGGLILSGLLLWSISADFAPLLSGVLIGFLLANSAGLLYQGNIAGIVVSLCIVATCCFFKGRFTTFAILCMAASLVIKPHDSVLVWLCFLFSGARYQRFALQVLVIVVASSACSVLWVASVAPNWKSELKWNLEAVSPRGAGNDPGPTSGSNTIANADINLQTVFAVIKDEPHFYNIVSYGVCGVLLVIWLIAARRSPITPRRLWISLGFLSALSMLPVYHRHHDAKLLMLGIPACAMFWAMHRLARTAALAMTSLAIVVTADVPRALLANLEMPLRFTIETVLGKVSMILLARPAPLGLLAMAILYLTLLWRDSARIMA